MSKYYIDQYNKTVNIDFSATKYSVKHRTDDDGKYLELIPDTIDFLHEVTELYPLDEYVIQIRQDFCALRGSISFPVYVNLDICHKDSNEQVFLFDSALLSDDDYVYIRSVLIREAPQYEWMTYEDYLRGSIVQFMGECCVEEFISGDALSLLSRIVALKYKEVKVDGHVGFYWDNRFNKSVQKIVEDVFRKVLESLEDADRDNCILQ